MNNKMMMNKFVSSVCAKPLMKMNLQMFAEGGDGGSDDGDSGDGDNDGAISFKDQSELDSWFDKKLEKSLETAQSKWEKDAQKRIEDAEKKGKMTAEEQAQYDLQQERDQLEADRVALQRDRDEASTIKRLSADKLPDGLADVFKPLFGGESEELEKTYTNVTKVFRDAVEQAVNIRLAGSAENPAGNTSGSPTESVATQHAKKANERSKSDNDNFWK